MGDDDGIIKLGLGILIGALFAYLIMKTKLQESPTTPTMQVLYVPYPPPIPAVQAAAPENVKVQTAEPVPPALPPAKNVKVMDIAKDRTGKLTLTTGDRKVGVRA